MGWSAGGGAAAAAMGYGGAGLRSDASQHGAATERLLQRSPTKAPGQPAKLQAPRDLMAKLAV